MTSRKVWRVSGAIDGDKELNHMIKFTNTLNNQGELLEPVVSG